MNGRGCSACRPHVRLLHRAPSFRKQRVVDREEALVPQERAVREKEAALRELETVLLRRQRDVDAQASVLQVREAVSFFDRFLNGLLWTLVSRRPVATGRGRGGIASAWDSLCAELHSQLYLFRVALKLLL